MTSYLTVEQVLFIHMRLIAETGGGAGLRDLALLASAVARPQATFGGENLYPDIFDKAASLLDSLIRNHPFVDGNKRAGITAAALFLRRNDRRLIASNVELERFTLQVARSELTLEEMAAWLRSHSVAASTRP
jgi:death-on-curing protein